ncbi:carbohydrate ABC transporter substrate-binding protein, CUT1 family [Micromonospora pattaloongensis]|uniref:Carbohydrate ABC transporter substrate-binding protein, CUT1 family n=1 Tax=Micromonospora pattaloongensis TaxID=405436 RepID=A0A1H3QU13_9ACTN|nr:extracellular solute-binding protein [Micromonospora pattaloongensis]SDZ16917.1 carbohydrate ABC transporter substrate-binding protein, CUT1 family [Micromonospora pattaloongensis]
MTVRGGVSRRAMLRIAAAATAASTAQTLVGCGDGVPSTQVAVVWSGAELQRFREVLRGYGQPVHVLSAGDDIDAFLRARQLAGTSPDVAILSRPGLLTEYAGRGWLAELDGTLATRFPTKLRRLLRHRGRLYGLWVKAAHKSLLWRLPSLAPAAPRTWGELLTATKELARAARRSGGPAPLSIGAADGWVLTDWFENVLADVAQPDTYDALAGAGADWRGPAVRAALDRLAELWSVDGAFPDGGRRALLTQHEESVIQVVARRRAAMVFEADFVDGVARRFRRGDEPLTPSRFPDAPADPDVPDERRDRPLVIGGDVAVVLAGSRTGTDLVTWLTGPDAFQPWVRAGGYLSPNLAVSPAEYRDRLRAGLAREILNATDLRFDLSDRLRAPFTGADGVGIWQIMQDFFADVTGGRVRGAVDRTTAQLDRAARHARSPR